VRKLGPHFIISILLLATPALAQGGELPGKGGGRKSGGKLDLPQGSPTQEEAQPEQVKDEGPYQSEFWGPSKDRAEVVFIRFEELNLDPEQSSKKLMRQALSELEGMGLGTRTTALKALGSPHAPSVVLAAQLLRAVGSREDGDARELVETSSSVGDVVAARECLDAAVVIDGRLPVRAIALLSHPKRPIRTLAEGRLRQKAHPDYVPDLLRGLQYGRDSDIRIRCARVLVGYPNTPEARDGLRAALRDPSVSVCFQAAESLAGDATNDDRAYIRQQIENTEPGEELAYLLFALLKQQDTSGDLLVDDSLVALLRPTLGNDSIFLSGVVGAVIAEYVFRTDTEAELDALQRSLPLVLVRSVGGVEFYPQYAKFSPVAEQSLQRISGQDFGSRNRRAWVEWYTENRQTFRLVRGQLELTAANQNELEVSWFHNNQDARFLTTDAKAGMDAPNGRVLGAKDLQTLADALRSTVILDVSVLPGSYGLEKDPIRAGIEVRIGARRKPIRFRGSAAATWLPELAAQLDEMYQGLQWQMLAQGDAGPAFLSTAVPQWDAATAADRDRLLVEFQNERIAALSPEQLSQWCDYVLAHPGTAKHWGEEAAYQYLNLVKNLDSDTMLAQKVLRVALLDGNPAMTAASIDVASSFSEPMRSDLLVASLRLLGPSAGAVCLKDPRLPVRVAAARSLADGGIDAVPALLSALDSEDVLVVRVALTSLGQIGDTAALDSVLKLSTPKTPREVRKEALLALGAFGGPAVLDALQEAAYADDFSTRLAAVSALRKVEGEVADQLFLTILPRYVGTNLEASFDQSLRNRGADLARRTYRDYLDSNKKAIKRRVAVLAGRLGEPAAVPVLMSYLPETPHDTEILYALAQSTCADFRATPDPAGVYEVWWRDHGQEDPSLWMVDGLKGRGYALEKNFVQGSGATPQTIVRNLLDVLERGPNYMRSVCTVYLTALTGIDCGHIAPKLPKVQVQAMAQPWHDWLRQP
jgi:hypothetical protein